MRVVATGLLCLCSAAGLSAQDARTYVTLAAHGGVLSQTGPFRQDLGALAPGWVSGYRFNRGGCVGASLELVRARFPLGIRLALSQSASLRLERAPGFIGAPVLEPASARVTTATIAMLLEPRRTCVGRVCPRLMLGGGVKRYWFNADLVYDDIIEPFADDQTRPTLQLGVGVRATVAGIVLTADISDFSNSLRFGNVTYPSKRTHDTIVSLGLGIRFPRA